jgi:putative nucleotidyltransferase with HDIG domain
MSASSITDLSSLNTSVYAKELVDRASDLPPFRQSVLRLLELMQNPEATATEVVEVVQVDPVISGKLLQVCNSGVFGLREKVLSVQHAVVFLGMTEVQRVTMAISTGGTLTRPLQNYDLTGQQFWRHCVITAQAAALIASGSTGLQIAPSVAYTAGLLHDIGKLVTDRALTPEDSAIVREIARLHDCPAVEAERTVLGASHADTGGYLLTKWGLPPVLVESVQNHHNPICHPTPELSALVHLADSLSYKVDAKPGEEVEMQASESDAAAALGLDGPGLGKVWQELQKRLEKVERFAAI